MPPTGLNASRRHRRSSTNDEQHKRAEERKAYIRAMEKYQAREAKNKRDLKLLAETFQSVKTEFADLDGMTASPKTPKSRTGYALSRVLTTIATLSPTKKVFGASNTSQPSPSSSSLETKFELSNDENENTFAPLELGFTRYRRSSRDLERSIRRRRVSDPYATIRPLANQDDQATIRPRTRGLTVDIPDGRPTRQRSPIKGVFDAQSEEGSLTRAEPPFPFPRRSACASILLERTVSYELVDDDDDDEDDDVQFIDIEMGCEQEAAEDAEITLAFAAFRRGQDVFTSESTREETQEPDPFPRTSHAMWPSSEDDSEDENHEPLPVDVKSLHEAVILGAPSVDNTVAEDEEWKENERLRMLWGWSEEE